MILKVSDSFPALRGKMLGVSPWINEHSEDLDWITISEMMPYANELRSKEASQVLAKLRIQTEKTLFDPSGVTRTSKVGNFTRSFPYSIKGIQFVHPGAMYNVSVAPKEKSIGDSHSSFSTQSYSDLKSNGNGKSHLADRYGDRLLSNILLQRPVTQSDIIDNQIGLSFKISNATHHEEIFDILIFSGHQSIAKRLEYLHESAQDDDPDDPDMDLLSLRKLALFFTDVEISLPDPGIVISHDGFLQAEWYSSNAAALMHFLPDGNIEFAATLTTDGHEGSQDIHGTGGAQFVLKAVLPLINQP
ncbi:MAG: hypothetical protein F4246_08980 [Rhodothermaceae bacterium]|nr:hypothetical protein [Rhodothermaceae bacterium]MXX58889.1 hypothetical protein [Rhodothermaceae bacterium]MYD19468.1 hypothetical protein [Rhodothermaceae bacterium]MYD57135.1 hypothetical protein [Rhodothermaceae bacterium]MYI44269.1 hypothetical protein [Rhodothermaceae bacterium]